LNLIYHSDGDVVVQHDFFFPSSFQIPIGGRAAGQESGLTMVTAAPNERSGTECPIEKGTIIY